MAQSEITTSVFNGHINRYELLKHRNLLKKRGSIRLEEVKTGGPIQTRWIYVAKKAK